MNQPEALRLAQALNNRQECEDEAADELRRLHTLLEAEQALHQRVTYPELRRLHAQRDALLEALRKHIDLHDTDCVCEDCAAIAKAEGEGA